MAAGVYDDIGKDEASFALLDNKRERTKEKIEVRDHGHATELLLQWVAEDAIVVGGGIGENAALIRERVFEDMDWCGIVLDRERNREVIDREGAITAPESKLPVWILRTQEGKMLARDVADAD